jgi:acyl carrier protein
MALRELIFEQLQSVAAEHKETLAPLSDELLLLESGLDSLSFAVIVARLEDVLGVDPFSAEEFVDFPVTLGDFVKIYENAVTKPA